MQQQQSFSEQVYTVRLNPKQRQQTRFALWANFLALLLNATLALLFWKLGTGKPLISLLSVFSSCLTIVLVGLYRKSTQLLTLTERGLRYVPSFGRSIVELAWSEIESVRIERNHTYTWLRVRPRKGFRRPILIVPLEQAEEIRQEIQRRLST